MAFTEFYSISGGTGASNLNAGSGTGAADVGATTVTVSGTNVAASSGTPFSGCSAGEWVSVYTVATDSVAQAIGRITAVNNAGADVDVAAWVGGTPSGIDTARVGGAWEAPAAGEGFPMDFMTNAMKDSSGNMPRLNMKGAASISTGITISNTGPMAFEGYGSTAGDRAARAVIDAGDNAITILTVSGTHNIISGLQIQNNDASGTGYGVALSGEKSIIENCLIQNTGGNGLHLTGNYVAVKECEFSACCKNTGNYGSLYVSSFGVFIQRCYFHDSTAAAHIYTAGATTRIENCVFDTCTYDGLTALGGVSVVNCDFYACRDGIRMDNSSAYGMNIENCNFIHNTGYGINGTGSGARFGYINSCRYGAGTMANTSGNTNGLKNIVEIGCASYADDASPWNDAANGDFTLTLAAARGTGRGTFAGGTITSKPDIGAAIRGGTFPAAEDVEDGVFYGAAGTEYEGTLVAVTPDYPAEADVQSGVSYGDSTYTGTLVVPAVADVREGTGYGAAGTEFTGTLAMLGEAQMKAILDARGLTEPASDTADSVARRGASAVTLSDVGSGGGAMHSTTIATLASQTSFTLTAGSADDDAYNYCVAVITDESTDAQKCVAVISDYTGASKTVTLGADPAIFTMAVGDTVEIYPPAGLRWINGAVAAGAETVEATLAAGAITSDAFAAGAIDADAIADGAIDAATFAADVDDEVRAWIVDNSTGDGVRIDSAALNTCTSVTIPAIKNKTDNLPSDPADQSAVEAAITAAASPLATSVELAAVQTHGDSTWATATGFLDAADVRDAIGMSAANLDTQLSAISGYVDCLPATWVVPPAGSDWTATRAGYVDKLNVTGTLANSDAAATYKADVSALATSAELTALASYGDSHWATATGFSTLDADDVRAALGMSAADLDDQLTAIGGTVDSLSSGVTVSDKTGFKLASDGLDAIATTAPSGPATTFREMVVQTWRRFFRKATKTSTAITTYADDGTTVITTQAIESVGSNEEQGAAT